MTRRRILIVGWVIALALSATLPLSALFRGLIHVGPQSLVFRTAVTKPIISVGGNVTLQRGATSIVLDIGGDIELHGKASDDLVALGGAVYLYPRSLAMRDVVSIFGTIYRSPDASTSGRLGGAVHNWIARPTSHSTRARDLAVLNIRLGLAAGLALLLVGTCLTIIFPWQVVLISTTLRGSPVKSIAAGTLSLVIFVFLVAPLGLSLAGLPFALLLTGAASLAWLFGLTAVAVVVGRMIARGTVPLIWATSAGLVVIAVGLAVPLVGPLVVSGLGLTGAGALAVALVSRSRPTYPAA